MHHHIHQMQLDQPKGRRGRGGPYFAKLHYDTCTNNQEVIQRKLKCQAKGHRINKFLNKVINTLHVQLSQAKQNMLTEEFHNLLHKLSQRYDRPLDKLPQAKPNTPTNATMN